MATLTSLTAALAEPQLTNWIGQFLQLLYENIGVMGWAVIAFTVVIKLILSPLDVWQKVAMRKNNKKMERVKPQMEKLQKQYANNKDMLAQKQMELYKKEKISMFGTILSSCLPLIVTMVVIILVFQGFQSVVQYQNEKMIYDLYQTYQSMTASGTPIEEINAALLAQYQNNLQGFGWIKNIYMPDTWANIVPTWETFSGTNIGQLNSSMMEGITVRYETLIGPAAQYYADKGWNGYLILPIASIALSVVSQLLMKVQTKKAKGEAKSEQQAGQGMMKAMMFVMPVMIGVFSLFYSAALSIYFFVSSLISTIFQLVFNLFTKRADKREQETALATTYIRKRDLNKTADEKPEKKSFFRRKE